MLGISTELVGSGRGLSVPRRTVNTAIAVEDGEGRDKRKGQKGSRTRGKAARVVAVRVLVQDYPAQRDAAARAVVARAKGPYD